MLNFVRRAAGYAKAVFQNIHAFAYAHNKPHVVFNQQYCQIKFFSYPADKFHQFCFDRSHIIGKSKPLMDVLATIKRIARTNASVLITGESGTGKELIAEAVHINSSRAKKPFVKVNLGGISHTLFESEMFGDSI